MLQSSISATNKCQDIFKAKNLSAAQNRKPNDRSAFKKKSAACIHCVQQPVYIVCVQQPVYITQEFFPTTAREIDSEAFFEYTQQRLD